MKLEKNRNFKNNKITFDESTCSVEISFDSNNLKLFKSIIYCYGFGDTIEDYGYKYTIWLNNQEVDTGNFDLSKLKKNDKIKICYNSDGCFSLYSHLIIHEMDDSHDDDFYLRKELEKWSI